MNAIGPRHEPTPRLISSICQYPFANPGEELVLPPVIVSMYKGDWQQGSDRYSAFTRSTYFRSVKPREWVEKITGWQRIIMRHQYGEIFFKYEDLLRLRSHGQINET